MNFHESRIELNSARASTIIRRVLIGCVSLVYQLYISHFTNYISLTVSTVFFLCINCVSHCIDCISLVYQLFITHCIDCISLTISTVFFSLNWLYFSHHLLMTYFLQSWILDRYQQLSTECWSGSWSVRLYCDYVHIRRSFCVLSCILLCSLYSLLGGAT